MNKQLFVSVAISAVLGLSACSQQDSVKEKPETAQATTEATKHGHQHGSDNSHKESASTDDFNWVADRFGDHRILRYQVPGFEA